ncbi:MAG: hypothetical protein KatS3mg024_0307 [Armatimonadota bacterium]|nr:MAG: hypothetical protein KatS3mg024_0307 [Armatimonadota bacterium]
MRLLTRVAAVLLTCVTSGSVAAQKITIPLPFDTLPGKTSKFKTVVDLDMNLFMMNQGLPIQGQLVMIQNVRYGTRQADGLAPVTTSLRISKLEGSVMGQSVPELKKALARMPEMPTVTSFFTRKGQLHSIKVSGIPGSAKPFVMKLDTSQIPGASFPMLSPPNGEIELGVPLVLKQGLSAAGIAGDFSVQVIPVEVLRAAGEDAVQFVVTSDGGQMIRFDSRGMGLPADVPAFTGSASINVSGEMLVGLRSGEPIRQNLEASVMVSADSGSVPVAGDLKIRLAGFRLQ